MSEKENPKQEVEQSVENPNEKILDMSDPETFETVKKKIEETGGNFDRNSLIEESENGGGENEKGKEPIEETEENEEIEQLSGQEEQQKTEEVEQGGETEDVEEVEGDEEEREELTLEDNSVVKLEGLKHNHEEFDETYTKEEIKAGMQMSMDYPRVKKQVQELRERLGKYEKYEVSEDELKKYKAIKNGDKKVIAQYMKENGIDPYDIDVDSAEDLKIEKDKHKLEFSDDVLKIASKNNDELNDAIVSASYYLPDPIREKVAKDEKYWNTLQSEVENGRFYRIAPLVSMKVDSNQEAIDIIKKSPIEFWKAYTKIGVDKGLIEEQPNSSKAKTNKKTSTRKSKNVSESKKRQANPKVRGAKKTTQKKTERPDFSRMSDEELRKYREKMANMGY